MQQDITEFNLQLEINPVDDSLLLQPIIELEPEQITRLTRKSYFFFVLQLRSGVTELYLKTLTSTILQSLEQIVEKGIAGISFVINGEHHPVKNLTFGSVKELLSGIMVIANRDDYHDTLVQTRHSIQNVANKLEQTKISLIFFFSFIEIDHSLGVKKRSYIDYLNEHEDICDQQVDRLSKTIRKYTDQCKTYIVSLDKNGYEQEDYSLSDTGLMNKINLLVGNYGSTIFRCYSCKQISDSFQQITSLLLNQIFSFELLFPIISQKKDAKLGCNMICNDMNEFRLSTNFFIHKIQFDYEKVNRGEVQTRTDKRLDAKMGKIIIKVIPNYKQLNPLELLTARAQLYGIQLNKISHKLSQQIVRYKRKYQAGKSYLIMIIDEQMLLQLRDRVYQIYDISKQIFQGIQISTAKNKHALFQYYSQLKYKIDYIQEVLLSIFKMRLSGSQIGKLSQLINLSSITKSIKNRLIRRVNSNPYLLDQVYRQIQEIVDGGKIDFLDLQVNSQDVRRNLGNCILSDYNFVKAMKKYDALGVAFQIQRPQSAIMDPGRIKIRQVSPYMMRASQFFEKFIYRINYTPQVVVLTLGMCKICKKDKCNKHFSQFNRNIEQLQVIQCNTYVTKQNQVAWEGSNKQSNERRNQHLSRQSDLSQMKIIYKTKQKTWEHNKIYQSNFQPDCECCRWSQSYIDYRQSLKNIRNQVRQVNFLREKGDLDRNNYKQRCDYTDRAGTIPTVLGYIPLYLTSQHWKIAKLLMKPSLGWTAAGEPLGYLFSQYQTIPFILLASIIRSCKQKDYEIQQQLKKGQKCKNIMSLNMLQTRINNLKQKYQRMQHIKQAVQITCQQIILELSSQYYEVKLIQTIKAQYLNYNNPLNRTVDIISSNSAFFAQFYCLLRFGMIQRPSQGQFHQFFIRLIEQQLRRQTDGWNEQETADKFIDKLLNVQSSAIRHWDYEVVGGQEYLQKFQSASEGYRIQKSQVQMQKQELEMLLRKQGKFNDSQRLLLIQYKRLYENRVLWLWYIRFALYGQRQRQYIHKWKCLGLNNSYMLFTLIIQNKRQRKNWKRREAIQTNQYTDPFDYEAARQFLQNEFVTLRNKKQGQAVKNQNRLVCERAADIFAYTGNLEQAAGTLVGLHFNSIRPFYNELLRGKAARIQQKLKMLLLGRYRNVYLFQGWRMNRQRFVRLSKKYPTEFERFKWLF